MKLDIIKKMGKKAFVQSLKPYKQSEAHGVYIFGLDSEYVPKDGQASDLISWQLAGEKGVVIKNTKLNIDSLFETALTLVKDQQKVKMMVFVVYFAIAEVQFFDLNEWLVSEFKGKYGLRQTYKGIRMMLVDLLNWYPKQKLEAVAKLWGREKVEYDIVAKVKAIEAGTLTKDELWQDDEFRNYALHDAVLCQQIYSSMREYFLKNFFVDIVQTLTMANTSASMFRRGLNETIGQADTELRLMALKCCWGGRMECLYRGHAPMAYEYDATGHHPNSAIALELLPREKDWKRTTNLDKWLSGISGLGRVHFQFREDDMFPCLPVFHNNSLVFPSEGVSYCSVSEAKLAKQKGAKMILFDGYYYKDGTDVLANYLRGLQKLRNESEDPAQRQLLKYLSNSIIGKFFQKNVGVDLQKVQEYAWEHQIPFEEAINMEGVDFGAGEVKVGSCFYPEWYALILGYARATIGEMAELHKAFMISSDSFVTATELPQEFEKSKIHYSLKASGEYVAYRTRFYRVGDKLAHHAVHSLDASAEVLKEFITDKETFAYKYHRFLHLKESWRDGIPFGARVEKPMTTDLGFDWKRYLLPDGTTRPHKNVEEREDVLSGKGQ